MPNFFAAATLLPSLCNALTIMRRFNEAMTAVNTEMMRQQIPLAIMNFLYGVFSAALGYSAASFAYRALVPAHESRPAA